MAMLHLVQTTPARRQCDGNSRREFRTVGALGRLRGLTLPALLRPRDAGQARKTPSVILLFLDGGASHIDTFDPKRDAPQEYRCLYGATPTALPGVAFSTLFPRMAKLAGKLAIVRS